jgi:hypothetical protein
MTSPRAAAGQAALILAIVLAVPLVWRGVLGLWGPRAADAVPSYLPVLESTRPREAFVADVADDLRRMAPGYVIVGDSMAGRIDSELLTTLSGVPVAPVLENATGSAYWYLVLKNDVAASGIRPALVVIFFRDTNLTDVTFRLDGPYRPTLDHVAHDREPELNEVIAARTSGPWHAVHRAADAAYAVNRAREWVEPALTAWPARVVAGQSGRQALTERINNAFTLDKLRPMAQADLEAADTREADFASHVNASVLPLMLATAREHGLRLCFVRVLRRPVNGQPPPESPELQRYVVDLGAYIRAHGAVFFDDRDDPELARLEYADGDHVSRDARDPYTRRFWAKVQGLPR